MLTGLSLFAYGCGQAEPIEPTSKDYDTQIGEIKSLGGIKVNKTITHLFENDDGVIYYAYSDRYDLDDPEYLGSEIEAYGVVMTFDDIDKNVFEIRRISEPTETTEEEEVVTQVTYKNSSLGFTISYPSNWEKTELPDSVKLVAPLVEDESESENAADYVIIAKMDAGLEMTSDDTIDDRASEIRNYVRSNYDYLIGVSNELSYVGVDHQFAVQYKVLGGDTIYFVPTGTNLIEISFYHPGESTEVTNLNTFAEMLKAFRLLPVDQDQSEEDDEVSNESDSTQQNIEHEEVEIVSTQVVPSGFREFESNPYKFSILYPSSWYFSGGSNGYDFSDEPLEDDTVALIRLDLNKTTSVGRTKSGNTVSITVKVEDRYYTLSGDAQYEEIMQEMADSITPITSDEL